ncbi:VTT domain-containing protein [Acetobacter sp. AN02]|uniref:TVP38/TMEM64 family protein n=1 Tax=Acetobacter sp. AN02 TaxID=2894186 RepID=UPI0024345449|nr:VTT domain-containing protein [Acetobacter sp. AN02]MDG6095208.1 VTT domain-containing protein [Acetobacter sp. AN02]
MTDLRVGQDSGFSAFRRPLLMMGLMLAAVLAVRESGALSHILDRVEMFRSGVSGPALFCLLGGLWCAFGLPRQVMCFAAGTAFGPWWGCLAATVATLAGACTGFFAARGGVRRGLAEGGRLAWLDRVLTREPFLAVLTCRLLPVGSALLISLLSGATSMPFLPFLAGSLIGSLPQTLVFVLIGGGLQAGSALGAWLPAVLGIFLFAVSGILGIVLFRRLSAAERGSEA